MNFKRSIILLSFFALIYFGCFYKNNTIVAHDEPIILVDEQGNVHKKLLELLQVTGVMHDESLANIVEQTQNQWLRKPGTERWDIAAKDWKNHADKIIELFSSLNLTKAMKATEKKYDYVLWMGAAYPCVEDRLQFLIQLFQEGLRFDHFVILSGARPLTENEKNALVEKYQIQDSVVIATEADAMKFVYENIAMPEAMKIVPIVFIDVPMFNNNDGSLRRPTTGDTVDLWLEKNPKPGSCLVISNQPYVNYQNSVVKTLLPKSFSVETVGEKSQDIKIDIYLDNLARFLYQEKKRLHL